MTPTTPGADRRRVAELLGREPRGAFEVVVRDGGGDPVVIRNAPLLDDGTPMPTLYWLVGPDIRLAVDRLEAAGGVREAEAAVEPGALVDAHQRYADLREKAMPAGWSGSRPAGGVGGTRRGVKCLHAHLAWHLAGGDDPVGRWVQTRLGSPQNVAAIDCGTNSSRLLVAGARGQTLARLMTITRLGQGVDQTHELSAAAIERTVTVLTSYRQVMDRHGVTQARVTATSAARDASNREEFFSRVEEAVGVRPELLSGDVEGSLSFAGATADLDAGAGPWLVADIGGGSTELAAGPERPPERDGGPERTPERDGGPERPPERDGGPERGTRRFGGQVAVRSLDVGCVRVTERWLHHDPPAPTELSAARTHIEGLLRDADHDLPVFGQDRKLIGLAGTVSAAAVLSQNLARYDRDRVHHHRLRRATVGALLSELARETSDERRRRPGMEAERADVIVGGLLVLDCLMAQFGFEDCLVSEADILDGLVMSMRAEASPFRMTSTGER